MKKKFVYFLDNSRHKYKTYHRVRGDGSLTACGKEYFADELRVRPPKDIPLCKTCARSKL